MNSESPQIMSCFYGSTTSGLPAQWGSLCDEEYASPVLRGLRRFEEMHQQEQPTELQSMANTNRRIVQVFIADPCTDVPLESAVLYKGDQKLTESTDQELYFEIPIAETLAKHNEKRAKWLDKEASKRSGKDVFLEPAKIRELKMVVVTIAQF